MKLLQNHILKKREVYKLTYVASVGIGLPAYEMKQSEVKNLVYDIFQMEKQPPLQRMLPVFDHAAIDTRQFVVARDWYEEEHSFPERNDLYVKHAVNLSLKAIDLCLTNNFFLDGSIPYEAVDVIIFVTSTGVSTPSIDTYLMNERPFRPNLVRIPLWGLGCAGGAMGLARAAEWLKGNPEQIALIVCCELCSLTFQKNDLRLSNIVGTALFGDGVAATLLIGKRSKYVSYLRKRKLTYQQASSLLKKNSCDLMGWEINEAGFKVIFSKQIPKIIDPLWKEHLTDLLQRNNLQITDLDIVLAHPGGRKILEEMEKILGGNKHLLTYSYETLRNHGNMSSATVLYVLKNYLESERWQIHDDRHVLLCALGPGFSSEILLLEWQA